MDRELAALGARLRAALTPRAVSACLGVSAIPAAPRVTAAPPSPCPPAAAPIWLWCAGRAVPASAIARALGPAAVATAIGAGLAVHDGDALAPAVLLAPLGASLVVCDVAARVDDDRVPWPDDSTLHLIGCLPPRVDGAWLDLGAGPAAAALAIAPGRGPRRATDVNPRALAWARLGLALAGRADVAVVEADLLDGAGGGWDLVTMNAPIPRPTGLAAADSVWHASADDLPARLWPQLPARCAPGAEVLVHATVDDAGAGAPPAALGGAVIVARYSPPGGRGFALIRWRPDAPARRVAAPVVLGIGRPFVTRADLDAIEAGHHPHPTVDLR